MKVRLLKKLRKEIYSKLVIYRNPSKFIIPWTYLSVTFNGYLYKTDREYGYYNNRVFKFLLKELEHIVLRDYINIKNIRNEFRTNQREIRRSI